MARPFGALVLGLAILAGPACGRKGPLELPPGREPMAVEKPAAFQRGDKVVLEWTNPDRAVSGRPLAVAAAEIRVLEEASDDAPPSLRAADVEKRTKPVLRIKRDEFPRYRTDPGTETLKMSYEHAFDGHRAGSVRFSFSIRVFDGSGRASEFCPPVTVETRVCPLPPKIGDVRVFQDFIDLAWVPPDGNIDGSAPASVGGYSVYRSEGGGRKEKRTPVAVAGERFEDRDFRFGASYSYTVRALAVDEGAGIESDDSDAVHVVPRDVFPPAPPAGLVAVPGPDMVSLSWESGPEKDPDGYRIWRKEQGEADFAPLTDDLVRETMFNDKSARRGTTYVYAVSALDLEGNESPKSESGPVTLKESRP